MLEKFTVENYKNFKDAVTIDFTETHDYRFNSNCVKNNLLSKMVIYGPNSSGKSNLGFALFDIVALLTDKTRAFEQLEPNSFLNADSNSKVARFEYVFKSGNNHIRYMYKKLSPSELAYEEMFIDNVKVFSYDFITQEHDFSNINLLNADTLNLDYIENNFSILRYIANNTIQLPNSYVKFIMGFVSNMLWFRSLHDNSYIGLTTDREDVDAWIVENNLVEEFQHFLFDMAGIDVKLKGVKVEQPAPFKAMIFEIHKNKHLPFKQCASSGAKTLQLFFYWSRRFDHVSFLFIDEFDAFYHFDLSWNILRYVASLTNIQAIFTTHNSYLASNELLRPDCYFLLDKGVLTSFAEGTDRELREGHNLEKMLRNGEFDVK